MKFCAYRFHVDLVISHIGSVCVIPNASHMSKTITKTLHGSPVSLYKVGFLFPELTAEFLAFDRWAQQAHFATLFVRECTYGTRATFCLSYYITVNWRDVHLHVPQSLFPSYYIVYFYKRHLICQSQNGKIHQLQLLPKWNIMSFFYFP